MSGGLTSLNLNSTCSSRETFFIATSSYVLSMTYLILLKLRRILEKYKRYIVCSHDHLVYRCSSKGTTSFEIRDQYQSANRTQENKDQVTKLTSSINSFLSKEFMAAKYFKIFKITRLMMMLVPQLLQLLQPPVLLYFMIIIQS